MSVAPVADPAQCGRARLAYLLYLANLSVLPGIAFLLMLMLWRASGSRAPFVAAHFRQALFASVVAGVLLAIVSGLIVMAGGLHTPWTWVILITYFTLCHSVLLLLGVLGFTRANNGRAFEFFGIASWRG